jgi:cell division protein FtsZ
MENSLFNIENTNENKNIIKVIGVGGGGSNAVNYMFRNGIKGVDFIVCNTDHQALDASPVPNKIQLGLSLTEGLGAGSLPEIGKNAAIESINEIKEILGKTTKMVFITAGMGGGTGTGGAPVIASVAREMGILTVGIVTIPFAFEGKKRKTQADLGLEELKRTVDTLIIICNDKLREIHGNLKLTDAFGHADNVVNTAAKGISDIITNALHINTDFADIQTVLKESGVAIMGSAQSEGENRALRAIELALNSPLLNDNNIVGARYVLLNITCGDKEITMDELGEINDYVQEAAGQTAEIIQGYGVDKELGEKVNVTIIATGFANKSEPTGFINEKRPEKIVYNMEKDNIKPIENIQVPVIENNTTQEIPNKVVYNLNDSIEHVSAEIVESPEIVINNIESAEITQNVVEFDIVNKVQEPNNFQSKTIEQVQENVIFSGIENKVETETESALDNAKRIANERIAKLRSFSMKLRSVQGLQELENEPAYKRKKVELQDTPHSSESQVSRVSFSENENGETEVKTNNPFLHDNVD